jgi:hypothetical protein
MLMWSYPHISETCFLWPLLGTGYDGIYYFSTFKMGLFHVRQGLGGKLFYFYIFYCMVMELDMCSTFYAKWCSCVFGGY